MLSKQLVSTMLMDDSKLKIQNLMIVVMQLEYGFQYWLNQKQKNVLPLKLKLKTKINNSGTDYYYYYK
ncbi:hypothetical protein DERP_005346 [Dermatophagoides pteronyssinus]|uniref:Uncharacterized protein n=1 Tax=Dermatophagoides pteronyssinus TaxID=6956 RepID=A0ABQ8JMV2_DERPT|nr:hypothetical protein DERP_005346 [Dermatophagoides pteronyssinus]